MHHYFLAYALLWLPPDRGIETRLDRATRLACAWAPVLIFAGVAFWGVLVTPDKDVRETPLELFAELEARFHFDLDAAASHENAKCDLYMTEDGTYGRDLHNPGWLHVVSESDGLTGSWKGRRVWANVPFSDIRPWVEKAWASEADLVVMLVPANRTEQAFWQELVEPWRGWYRDCGSSPPRGWGSFDVEFLPGRIRFLKDGKRMGSPMFGCCLLVWQR